MSLRRIIGTYVHAAVHAALCAPDGPPPQQIRRILVARNGYLGDVLQSTPLVRALRDGFEAEVDYLTTDAGRAALIGNPYVHRIITRPWSSGPASALVDAYRLGRRLHGHYDLFVGLSPGTPDWLLACTAGIKTRVGLVLTTLRPVGFGRWVEENTEGDIPRQEVFEFLLPLLGLSQPLLRRPFLAISDANREHANNLLRGMRHPIAAIAPSCRTGTAQEAKRLWPIERWEIVASHLAGMCSVAIVGTESDSHKADQILRHVEGRLLCGRTSITELGAVLEKCAVLISVDTMPVFAAAAVGCPSVVVYGPERPSRSQPLGVDWVPLGGAESGQPRSSGTTLSVHPDEVTDAVLQFIERNQRF
jgi:heptosyltransferase-2